MGKSVLSNDYMAMSAVFAKAMVENNAVVLSDVEARSLLRTAHGQDDHFVSSMFKGLYFADEDNAVIDTIRANIGRLRNPYKIAKQKGISVEEAQAIVAKEKDKLEKKKAKAEADRVKREEMKAEERRKMEEELEFFGTDDSELKKELREEGIYLVKAPKSIKEAGGRIPRSVRQHNEAKRKKAAEKLKRAQRNKKKK